MTDALFNPFSPAHHADADRVLSTTRSAAGVWSPYPGVYVVSGDAGVRDALTDTEHFSNAYNFDLDRGPAPEAPDPFHFVTRSDGAAHAGLRRFLRRWFAPAHLRRLEPRVREIVAAAIADMPARGQADLVHHLARVIPTRTVYALIGIPVEDWATLQALADESNSRLPKKDRALLDRIFRVLGEVLDRRRESGERRDDIIDGLLYPGENPPFDPAEATGHLFQLLAAGTDTTTALIGNVLYRLLEDPARWQRVTSDPALISAAVEESLRRDSPLQYTLRTAASETRLGECPVAPRDRVVLSLQSANADEKVWGENALEFDLDREGSAAHVAFAIGVHTCLGAPLARLEARATIEALAARFPGMRLAGGHTTELVPIVQFRIPRTLTVDLNA